MSDKDKCSTREEKCTTRAGQVCDGPRQDRCTGRVPRLPPPPSARPAWPLFAPDLRKGVGGAGETLMTVVAAPRTRGFMRKGSITGGTMDERTDGRGSPTLYVFPCLYVSC